MSLYAEFLKEYKVREIVENDNGYATFEIVNDHCYLEDIYVIPAKRRMGVATQLAIEVEAAAKAKGCKYLIGSLVPNLKGSHERMLAILSYGFKLQACRENFIFFQKEIS